MPTIVKLELHTPADPDILIHINAQMTEMVGRTSEPNNAGSDLQRRIDAIDGVWACGLLHYGIRPHLRRSSDQTRALWECLEAIRQVVGDISFTVIDGSDYISQPTDMVDNPSFDEFKLILDRWLQQYKQRQDRDAANAVALLEAAATTVHDAGLMPQLTEIQATLQQIREEVTQGVQAILNRMSNHGMP